MVCGKYAQKIKESWPNVLGISVCILQARASEKGIEMAGNSPSCLHASLESFGPAIPQAGTALRQETSTLAVIQALPSPSPDFLEYLTLG